MCQINTTCSYNFSLYTLLTNAGVETSLSPKGTFLYGRIRIMFNGPIFDNLRLFTQLNSTNAWCHIELPKSFLCYTITMHIMQYFKAIFVLVGITTVTFIVMGHLVRRDVFLISNLDLIDKAENLTTRILEMKHTQRLDYNSDYIINKSTTTFPKRSPKQLDNHLSIAKEILAPVFEEIEKIRKVLLLSNYTWQRPTRASVVLSSQGDSFMSQLAKNSKDILHDEKLRTSSNIRTLTIFGEQAKVKQIFPTNFFMDYTTNNCKYVEAHSIYGNNMGISKYNASCHDNITKAWQFKPFQHHHFRTGLPPDMPHVTNESKITLGYIHVVKNAVVG